MESISLYEGISFQLPQQPPKESIFGYSLPKEKQKWQRTPFPEKWEGMDDYELEQLPEYLEFAFAEDKKCKEGFWFYNNGVPTYITGDNYHYLNWYKIDVDYPQYRDVDRRWFYVWEVCCKDADCMGIIYGKKRRDGFSYRGGAIMLNEAKRTFNSNYGIISKTGGDAKECFDKIIHAFREYPQFFKPQVQSVEDAKKELVFKTPQQRLTHKNRRAKKEISLNTKLDYKNTKENSYDGYKLKKILADETGKMEEANFEKWFSVARTCLIVGGNIIGKMICGSSVNEKEKGGAKFKKVWDLSDSRARTNNGRTTSGLFRYFVPAYDGLEGFIDEYGLSVIETPTKPLLGIDGNKIKIGSKEFLLNERNDKKSSGDTVGYYEHMRQFPFNEEDMFRNPANEGTPFDLDRLYEQKEYNDSINLPIVKGNFIWKGGVKDSEVEWHPDKNGRWTISWLPKNEERNKFIMKGGRREPANTHIGVFGLDPYDGKYVKDKNRASNAAAYGFRKLDPMNPSETNVFISQYLCRQNDPYDMYEDMIKMAVFFGWKILIERNRVGCIRYFENRGYANYLFKRPVETQSEYIDSARKNKEEDYGIPMTVEEQGSIVEATKHYIYNNVGKNPATGVIGKCYFNELLSEWIEFDNTVWTPFDAVVGAGLALLASREYIPKKTEKKSLNIFPQFKVSGDKMTRI